MNTEDNIFSNISEVQENAIKHNDSTLLLLAGAGSGKTLVITKKIAYLVQVLHVPPENIMAVTFTNKSAKEMKERASHLLKNIHPYRLNIRTFHSQALRILKTDYAQIGYKANFTIVDEQDKLTIMKNAIKFNNIEVPKDINIKACLKLISKAKNSEYDVYEYLKEVEKYGDIFTRLYRAYSEYSLTENVMDFDDLIINVIKLFEQENDVLEFYRRQWRYILVDEFQDTNYLQYKFINLLTQNNDNQLTVVGDDDQSIYAFRGAKVSNILDFKTDYPDTFTVKLEENYRCPKDIVEAALSVIRHNKNRHDKNVFSNKENENKIQNWIFASDLDEAKKVAEEIECLFDDGFQAKDIVILFRTNSQSRLYEKELLAHNIDYKIVGGTGFFERAEIKDAIAFLRLFASLFDNVSFRRIINKPPRSIGEKTLSTIELFAYENNIALYEAIEQLDNIKVTKKTKEKLIDFKNLIEATREKIENNLKDIELIFTSFLLSIDYYSIYKGDEDLRSVIATDNIKELFRAFYDYKAAHAEIDESSMLISFLEELTLTRDVENANDDVVTLMTVHNAKGLEYETVFLTGLEMGVFPHYFSLEEENGIDEERRLCYVAITRAKRRLYLTQSSRRRNAMGIEYNKPSIFLNDIPKKLLETKYIESYNPNYIDIDDDAFDY